MSSQVRFLLFVGLDAERDLSRLRGCPVTQETVRYALGQLEQCTLALVV